METCANVNISWWVNDWAFLHGSDVTGPVSLKGSRFPSGKLFITAIHERSLSSDANSSSVEGSRAFLFPEFFKYLNMLKREWVAFDLLGDLLHLIFDDNLSGRFLISKLNWFYFILDPHLILYFLIFKNTDGSRACLDPHTIETLPCRVCILTSSWSHKSSCVSQNSIRKRSGHTSQPSAC